MSKQSLASLLRQGVIFFASSLLVNGLLGQDPAPTDSTSVRETFPGGVTPSDVYARLDLLDRLLDRVLEVKNAPAPPPLKTDETNLGPLHVYSIMIACASRSQELDDQVGVLAVPTLSAKPRNYFPRDVRFVVDLMIDSTERIAEKLAISDLPTNATSFSGKTPTDVFNRGVLAFLKFNALCGHDEIAPKDVLAEMVRVTEDVRSILRQSDPESRYRIDAPPSAVDLEPIDVYKKCLAIRRVINKHRLAFGVEATQVPDDPTNEVIEARGAFIQTQIILAELNHLKMLTKTTSSTPLAVPVEKTVSPSNVHQQASLVEHLLLQVKSGANVGLPNKSAKIEHGRQSTIMWQEGAHFAADN